MNLAIDRANNALPKGFVDGDQGAFNELYERFKNSLFRFIRRQIGNGEIAEEVFQETWLSIHKSRKLFDPDLNVSSYIFRIAHNKVVDYYRANSKAQYVLYDENDDNNEDQAATTTELDKKLHLLRGVERLLSLVDNLPAHQREVFLLKEESGLSIADIAKVMEAGEEATKSRLRYAMKYLRNNMRDMR